MSYPTKAAATKAGRYARKLLNHPGGWEIRVWENCGWYASLRNGPIELYFYPEFGVGPELSFHALMGEAMDESGMGHTQWTTSFHHANPNRVIAHQKRAALKVFAYRKPVENFLHALKI